MYQNVGCFSESSGTDKSLTTTGTLSKDNSALNNLEKC